MLPEMAALVTVAKDKSKGLFISAIFLLLISTL